MGLGNLPKTDWVAATNHIGKQRQVTRGREKTQAPPGHVVAGGGLRANAPCGLSQPGNALVLLRFSPDSR